MPTVLVIDSEPSIRALCRGILEAAGFQAVEAADCIHWLRARRGSPVDLVLCAALMPDQETQHCVRELARTVPAPAPDTPVVVLSCAIQRYSLGAAARAFGAVAALPKPFKPGQLLDAVRVALERHATHAVALGARLSKTCTGDSDSGQ